MNTCLDCLPCIFRQTLDAVRRVSDDPAFHEKVVRQVAEWICGADLSESPPAMAQRLHRYLRGLTGIDDPYAEAKARDNELALRLLPGLRERLAVSDDPFTLAVRLAIAGNLIDLGPKSDLTPEEVEASIGNVEKEAFSGDVAALRRRVEGVKTILYLADNAGEIVLDRLLIEALGPERVTVAVRGAPVINDATMDDARTAGLHELVSVISNGSDAPGTLLEECAPEFREHFDAADLVISKGQGNFETLSEAPRDICFLFKVKCPVIAGRVDLALGTQALVWLQGEAKCKEAQ
ncbi:MAG: ARMT1-like domain-containing protein [Kiritimatiellae bacterium]|nr:ARMT1-like domain-containing protein [Kiritimatiellia bacterium]